MKKTSVGVAFITHNSAHHFPHCLPPIIESSLQPKVLVVISSKQDRSKEQAEKMGAATLCLDAKEYNHGLTREKARNILQTDIVVMMTPDAYAEKQMLEKLVAPIIDGTASIAYARQLPHKNADLFEAFPREFNYPETSHCYSLQDAKRIGPAAFFCSNSCAAYSQKALDQIGGFPSVLLGEDTCATAKLLCKGHKIAYVAEARVAHSHRYSIKQEFQRYFDTGLARESYRDLLLGTDKVRGKKFAKAFVKKILKENPLQLPYAILHTLTKWVGYQIGQRAKKFPVIIKKALSSQKFYWSSDEWKKQQHQGML